MQKDLYSLGIRVQLPAPAHTDRARRDARCDESAKARLRIRCDGRGQQRQRHKADDHRSDRRTDAGVYGGSELYLRFAEPIKVSRGEHHAYRRLAVDVMAADL